MENRVYFGDNLAVLESLPSASVDLVYIDPPFNTGKVQGRTRIKTVRAETGQGDRVGFGGNEYKSVAVGSSAYGDIFDDFLAFLEPRLREAYRVLKHNGSLYFHIDYREVHYCKILLDNIFGRDHFLNEIIWAYDYGGRGKNRWPAKHDNILLYVKDIENYTFNWDEVERIPYMAPGLVSAEKRERGKFPTDVWWHTIVATNGKEKTGYPTQKPMGVLRRILQASANPGDVVLDFFAGSGTTGEAALERGCTFLLADNNPQAIAVMRERFAALGAAVEWITVEPPPVP
ncbi:MAG: RsmD family RNA methyltransferase [Anaerolineae bacterium]|nr:RsmD family RNA methyltransferase [Anaerolineae bacterium]